MKKTVSFVCAVLLGFFSAHSGTVLADDTEIYLGNKNLTTSGVRPNVLFILDSSGSMSATVPGTGMSRLDNMKQALNTLLNNLNNVNVGLMDFTDPGGPVLFPVADLDAPAESIENPGGTGGGTAPDLQATIPLGTPDSGYETVTSGGTHNLDLGSDRIRMGRDSTAGTPVYTTVWVPVDRSAGDAVEDDDDNVSVTGSLKFKNNRITGLWFSGVNVPQGTTISNAYVFFKSKKDKNGAFDLRIRGDDRGNAPLFIEQKFDLSNRPSTSASVTWSPPDFTKNVWYVTPNIGPILQEIAGRPDWSPGNAMALLFEHLGGSPEREMYSYDDGPRPWMYLQYVSGYTGGSVTDRIGGLRFTGIDIPQGVTITSAVLKLTAAQDSSSPGARYRITAHLVDDAPAYDGSVSTAISDRATAGNRTVSEVIWDASTGLTDWVAGNVYQSPDLSAILQEIVSRPGWCGGNAVVLTIEPLADGERVAYSSRATGTAGPAAPILEVNYDHNSVPAAPGGCRVQTVQRQINLTSDDATEVKFDTNVYPFPPTTWLYSGYMNGFRFNNMEIPPGAEVLSANLIFTIFRPAYDDRPVTLTYYGENTDDSLTFTRDRENVSGRARTSASVSETVAWNNAKGETVEGADISPLIQEIVNRPGWREGNAISIIQDASSSGLAYIGVESFDGNAAAAPVLKVKVRIYGTENNAAGKTVRKRLKEIVQLIPAYNWTPIVSTLYEAVQYYRGGPVTHGKSLSHLVFVEPYTQVSHPASWTGGNLVSAGCAPTMGILDPNACTAISGTPVYVSPMSGASCQANYIVLLTDGEANHNAWEDGTDHGVGLISTLMGKPCDNSVASGEKCGRELAEFINTEDQSPVLDGKQTIQLYTIGFNLGGYAPAESFLKDLAKNGGGTYNTADTAGQLADVFKAIVVDVLNRPTSYATPALTINAFNRIYHLNEMYMALFTPDRSSRWEGNVKKYHLCDLIQYTGCELGDAVDRNGTPIVDATGNISATAWSEWSTVADGNVMTSGGAAEHVPGYAARTLYTWTGGGDPVNVDLSGPDNALDASNPTLTGALLGDAAMTPDQRSDLIAWIRGRDVDDEDGDGNTTDDRYRFGDVLHASPVAITYGGNASDPVIRLFVASNDGFLRMLDAATGEEMWAFMPQDLLAAQKDLRADANTDHIYGLDATPVVWRNDINGDGIIDPGTGEFVRLYFGMRRGGRNIYALDVTPDTVLSPGVSYPNGGITPKLMWRIRGGDAGPFAALGQTWSDPVLITGLVESGGTVSRKKLLVFGGGNDTMLDNAFGKTTTGTGNAVYVVDAETGDLIQSISGTGSGATIEISGFDWPVVARLTPNDLNRDGVADSLYFGDLGGNVWRVDLAQPLVPGSPSGTVVGHLADISYSAGATDGGLDVETRKFYHAADVISTVDTVFSEVSRFTSVAIVSGNRPTPRSTAVHDRAYVFRDFVKSLQDTSGDNLADNYPMVTQTDCPVSSPTQPCLFDATANALQKDATGNPVDPVAYAQAVADLSTSNGWYVDLVDPVTGAWSGLKGASKPVTLLGRMFFTVYAPDENSLADPCQLNAGAAKIFGLDLLNGTALFKDWDTTDTSAPSTADRAKTVGAGMPSEIVAAMQEKGTTLILGAQGAPRKVDPGTDDALRKTWWLQLR